MTGQILPNLFDGQPYFIGLELTLVNLAEDTRSLMAANGDEISACLYIIIPSEAD